MTMRSCFLPAALAVGVVAPNASTDAALRYRSVLLEPLDGGNVVAGHDINASGVVSGTSGSSQVNPGQHAVTWTDGALVNLDPLFNVSHGDVISDSGVVAGIGSFCPPVNGPCSSLFARALPGGEFEPVGTLGGNAAVVNGINASGDFVGWGYDEDHMSRAFLYTEAGGLMNLGTLGGFSSQANALNDQGLVVGSSYTGDLGLRAFAWQDGAMLDLGTLGGTFSSALDVNGAGVVVGYAAAADGNAHAFAGTVAGGLEDLQTLPGAVWSRATVINGAGTIGGLWSDGATERLFVHVPGEGTVDLGTPLAGPGTVLGPIDINASGAMVGVAVTDVYEAIAWHWSPETGLALLEDLVVAGPALNLTGAGGLNDAGTIVVTGFESGTWQAVSAVLEPVHAADLNADGVVNVADLVQLVTAWGACGEGACVADTNGDGVVDVDDLVFLIVSWG